MARDVRMSELIEANSALEQQLRDWQTDRHRRNENAFDWEAFRVAVSYMGVADPGIDPPAEFFWFTPPGGSVVETPVVAGSTASTATKVPSARLVSPGRDRGTGGSGEPLTEVKYWR
jgi:hypothetical protein